MFCYTVKTTRKTIALIAQAYKKQFTGHQLLQKEMATPDVEFSSFLLVQYHEDINPWNSSSKYENSNQS